MSRKKRREYKIDSGVNLDRNVHSGSYKFSEIFSGFERIEAVKSVFGENTLEILADLNVEVFPKDGFMGVSDEDGHIFASQTYLNSGDHWSIYLDVVHELVHVRQFREGKELFDKTYAYVDRPTEIEAYRIAAEEGRRIGLNEEEIFEYLRVPWISDEEHERLALSCEVSPHIFQKIRNRVSKKKSV
ncbi:MAG: hypothetical protein ACYC7D_11865 [Nitrososphaerales archaeon]